MIPSRASLRCLLTPASAAVLALVAVLTPACELGQPGPPVPPARATACPPPPSGTWSDDTTAAWEAMQSRLAGRWVATTPEKRTVTVAYRVISNGSALLETWTSQSGKETASVYHPDGRGLMLTHYCAQGNQARLRATEATGERIVFRYADATNVSGEQGIMQSLVFTLRADGFDQVSEYLGANGQREATTLHFTRATP